jgi:glycosyltransferase involved in cell wall biosynthesis
MLESAYAAATVFTLPSQFETPGIAALEAALAGCSIAITEAGGTREYFGDLAEYINPEKEISIMPAIRSAFKNSGSESLKKHVKENYSWSAVALKTEEAYRSVL